MKKITAISSLTAIALVLSLTTIYTNQSKRSIKKNGFKLTEMRMGLNKAFAAAPAAHHQDVYDSAKREVNMEVKYILDDVNKLLAAANISKCSDVPAVSGTAFHASADGDLYSSAVGGKTFPISTVAGVVFSKKIELKIAGTGTVVGVLYADCNTGAMEVRVKGRLIGEDTDIVIAYHEDNSTDRQSILMFSDYDADGYAAAKIAVHYIESATSQTVTYAYAEDAVTGYRGTLTANTAGTVTDAVDANVTGNAAATDLLSMTGIATGFTLAGIDGHTMSL